MCVAAVDVAIADAALKLIDIEWEILEPILDFEKALDNPVLVHPEPEIYENFPIGFDPKRNLAAGYHMEVGNVEDSLKDCDVVLDETFYTQAQAHAAMEPHTVNAKFDYQNRLMILSRFYL